MAGHRFSANDCGEFNAIFNLMTGTPEPLPDHLVLLALVLCLILTFALAYQVRPSSWYFERQLTPDHPPASVVESMGRGESSPVPAFATGFTVRTEG